MKKPGREPVRLTSGEQAFVTRACAYAETASREIAADGSLSSSTRARGRRLILGYFEKHGRVFPWRETTDAYAILLSEVMLQQTQTARVAEYYDRFLARYPAPRALANAPLRELLLLWKGLGYNRRALMLQRACRVIADEHRGKVPLNETALCALPGIGSYTARAILAFAADHPSVLIETNVRTVFLHLFFRERDRVTDREIEQVARALLPMKDSRRWHYALMDFGALLKKALPSVIRKSAHYRVQSKFEGSSRQLRAMVLHEVASKKSTSIASVVRAVAEKRPEASLPEGRQSIDALIRALTAEGLLSLKRGRLSIPG